MNTFKFIVSSVNLILLFMFICVLLFSIVYISFNLGDRKTDSKSSILVTMEFSYLFVCKLLEINSKEVVTLISFMRKILLKSILIVFILVLGFLGVDVYLSIIFLALIIYWMLKKVIIISEK